MRKEDAKNRETREDTEEMTEESEVSEVSDFDKILEDEGILEDEFEEFLEEDEAEEAPEEVEPIVIHDRSKDPALSLRRRKYGKVEETALDRKQERDLHAAMATSLLKKNSHRAVQTIIEIMNDPTVKDDLRLKAATDIVDRVLGKAKTPVEKEISGGITITLSQELDEYSR